MLTSLDTENIPKKALYPGYCKSSATFYTKTEVSNTSLGGSFSFSIITCWRTYNCSPAMCLEGGNKALSLVLAYLHLQEYTFYPSVFAKIEVNYDKCLGIYNHQQQEI